MRFRYYNPIAIGTALLDAPLHVSIIIEFSGPVERPLFFDVDKAF